MNSPISAKTRAMISVFMVVGFGALLVTGILSYGLRYSPTLSAIHTIFGIVFIVFGVFHLRNNFKVFLNYLRQKAASRWLKLGLLMVPVSVMGVMLGLPPFQSIIDFGYALKELRPIDRQVMQTIETRFELEGRPILVDVKTGDYYSGPGPVVMGVQISTVPQMAVWIEDTEGKFLETLYVTKKGATGSYISELFSNDEVRRPEALPHWSFKRGVKSEDGLLVPSQLNPLADALTGATPLNSYELKSRIGAINNKVVVKMEVNRSFDYNETFHPDAFPKDPIYSGSGNTAQPSLIYAAEIDFTSGDRFSFMKLLGRGHHSGKHGDIIDDISGITTAKHMIERAIVDIGEESNNN